MRDEWRSLLKPAKGKALDMWLQEYAEEVNPKPRAELLEWLRVFKEIDSGSRRVRIPVARPAVGFNWEFDVPEHFGRFALFVDWSKPDDEILAAFGEWIKLARPRPPIKRDGRGLHKKAEAETDLKALAALRLWRKSGSINQASIEAKGVTLYLEENGWYKARKRAQTIIDDLNNGWCPFMGWPWENDPQALRDMLEIPKRAPKKTILKKPENGDS